MAASAAPADVPETPPEEKPKRETWRDWWPNWMPESSPQPRLLTREEVVKALRDQGVEISTTKLRFWEQQRILPRPNHHLPPGATDGKARALYPEWSMQAIKDLLSLVVKGASLAEISHIAPMYIERIADKAATHASRFVVTAPVESLWYKVTSGPDGSSWSELPPKVSRALRRAVWEYADRTALSAQSPTNAELTFTREGGATITIPILPLSINYDDE